MKRPIAMKCTQEQFDAIKDKLVGCNILTIENFENNCFLINNYSEIENRITNFNRDCARGNDRIFYETWNEEIFLNACGIENERIFKGSELQYLRYGKWVDFSDSSDNNEYRLKPANLIKKQELKNQILELQIQLNNL